MKTIHKYVIEAWEHTEAMLPGVIVHAEAKSTTHVHKSGAIMSRPHITLWVEGKAHLKAWRKFEVYGTGAAIPEYAEHIITWRDGQFVWHLYEVLS